MKKILMIGVILLTIGITLSAASAAEWNFDFSSTESSNTDGGAMSFDNGKLTLQDIEFNIPDGYKENESARKLAEPADDPKDAKFSVCIFKNGDKELMTKVYFSDDVNFDSLTPNDDGSSVEKTMAGTKGIYFEDKYNDGTPTFEFLKDGKIIEINAPDDDTIESVMK